VEVAGTRRVEAADTRPAALVGSRRVPVGKRLAEWSGTDLAEWSGTDLAEWSGTDLAEWSGRRQAEIRGAMLLRPGRTSLRRRTSSPG